LTAIAEAALPEGESVPLWYCISRGHYVGVTLNRTLAINAVLGVSGNAMKSHKSQVLAVAAFNELLQYRMVAVIP
jgi:hypothetical protein